MEKYLKKGYLYQHFRIFHLRDVSLKPIPFHYHDFNKIILFISGEGRYIIEGKDYPLQPRDILFVRAGQIHKPVTIPGKAYERIVIYVSEDFLQHWQKAEWGEARSQLDYCFQRAQETSSVMHTPKGQDHDLLFHMKKLEKVAHNQGFANQLYTEILFVEFMILLNRAMMDNQLQQRSSAAYDPRIQQLLEYINTHLAEELSINQLSQITLMSKYYMMRSFKAATGFSIHQYISSKRMIMARELLKNSSASITDICYQCGFQDYSTFSREFKKQFNLTPREYRNNH